MKQYDVTILGGGLAGLTLSLQLKQELPALNVLVIERRAHPVREAAHKVGESSVEIGAHYFDTILGLKGHLDEDQLLKFGLRFFFSHGCDHLEDVLEVGGSRNPPTPSYQLDRGIFENFLGERARAMGVEFVDDATVREIDLTSNDATALHTVTYRLAGNDTSVQSRWVVDAAGRASLLKRKLGLAEDNAHDCNAVWFRIGTKIDIDAWSDDTTWLERCESPPGRWLSTNHFMGPGYWVWLIPLSSGSHSVGIVADPKLHPLNTMNTFERALEWLHTNQPRIGQAIAQMRDQLQDFLFLRNFSHGCKQVYSADRWALTGEAGVFLDPFYSPGSDFIGISNTYVTDLIVRDMAGEHIGARAQIYQQLYFSFYESTLSMYTDQYPMFGDPEIFPIKITWDYTFYWGTLCQFFFQRRMTDLTTINRLSGELEVARKLNFAMQKFMREWAAKHPSRNVRGMIDQATRPWFVELNRALVDPLTEEELRLRVRENVNALGAVAREILAKASAYPDLDSSTLRAVLESMPPVAIPAPLLFEPALDTRRAEPAQRTEAPSMA